MSEWKEKSVESFCDVIGGGTPSTKIKDYWNGDIIWLTPKDLTNNNSKYISESNKRISALGLQKSSAKLLPKGSILISSRAPVGYIAIAKAKLCTNQGFRSLVPKDNIYNEYIYYLMKNNVEYLQQNSTGTTFQELAGGVLKNLKFNIPLYYEEQKEIADILSSLDDKIDLLNRQNKTLEDLASTYFRQWFIEEKHDDWEEKGLDNEFEIIMGQSPKGDTYNENKIGIPFYQGNADFGKYIPVERIYCEKPKKIAEPGNYLLSVRAPVGELNIATKKCCIGRGLSIPKNKFNLNYFAYFRLKNLQPKIRAFNDDGTVFGSLTKGKFLSIKDIGIPFDNMEKYNKFAKPFLLKIIENEKQIQTLTKLRDTLLPKLISGEIRIK